MNKRSVTSLVFATIFLVGIAGAQTLPAPPAPTPTVPPTVGAYHWFGRVGLVCGGGASYSTAATKPTVQCGGVFSGPLFDLEAGVMGPQATHSAVSGYLSTNIWLPLAPFRQLDSPHGVPLVVGGFTRMFEAGSALDYGLAYAHPIDSSHSIQFEVRDYWIVKDPQQHNVVLRVVWLTGLPD